MYIPKPSKYDPDNLGHFGIFGGRYVPETLMPALLKLNKEYEAIRFDKDFWREVHAYLKDYVGQNPFHSVIIFGKNKNYSQRKLPVGQKRFILKAGWKGPFKPN